MDQHSSVSADGQARKDEGLWESEDVARYLRVTVATVRNYIRDRGLPHFRISGGVLRFHPEDIRMWVRNRPADVASDNAPDDRAQPLESVHNASLPDAAPVKS